jgi:hypothetical protein
MEASSYIDIFKRGHHKNHQVLRASFLLLQITATNIHYIQLNYAAIRYILSVPTKRFYHCYVIYLLQIYFWETNMITDSQKFPRNLWNPNGHYHVYKSPSPAIYRALLQDCSPK